MTGHGGVKCRQTGVGALSVAAYLGDQNQM